MVVPVVYIILLFLLDVFCLEKGDDCITPNGEQASCIELDSCKIIKDAIVTGNKTAIEFSKESQCGFTDVPLICCGSAAFQMVANSLHHFLDKRICGLQKPNDRVFGGLITEIGEYPWMVLLGYRNVDDDIEFNCGGTLINNRYVLTAAHCLRVKRNSGKFLDIVRLGEWRISTEEDCNEDLVNDECADPVIDIGIEKQIPHVGYSRKTGNNDIALLRLESDVEYSEYVSPICLPNLQSKSPNVGTVLVLSGWGITENGSQSDIKLKLEVPVVSNTVCAEKIRDSGEITENQVCAGGEKSRDACQGDSGGPLMKRFEITGETKYQWFQEGIVAWGIGCGRKNYPGIYTKTTKYMNWILDKIL